MDFASSEPIVVFLTAPSAEEATRIAEMLVSRQLAACVQILPEIKSIYVWKNELQREQEVLMLAKTTRARFAELEREVREMHSYETPEIIAVSMVEGSADYLKWLMSSCEGS